MSETILGSRSGRSLAASERVALMGGPPVPIPRAPLVIGTFSIEAIGVEMGCYQSSNASTNYPTANLAYFIPFGVAQAITVVKLWVYNGAAVAGNMDMGLYNADGTLIVSKGSTAVVGTSATQELDITDTLLNPGRYYLAFVADTSGSTERTFAAVVPVAGSATAAGVLQQATAFPLASNASPATFATCTQVSVPTCGLNTRTLLQ